MYEHIILSFSTRTYPHSTCSSHPFPFFESDVFTSYKNNVKSFVHIATEAFKNDFPQSGLSSQEMIRLTQALVLDCNEIIQSMKMTFTYPIDIKEIDRLETIQSQIEYLESQFTFPNNVMKPLPENERTSKP